MSLCRLVLFSVAAGGLGSVVGAQEPSTAARCDQVKCEIVVAYVANAERRQLAGELGRTWETMNSPRPTVLCGEVESVDPTREAPGAIRYQPRSFLLAVLPLVVDNPGAYRACLKNLENAGLAKILFVKELTSMPGKQADSEDLCYYFPPEHRIIVQLVAWRFGTEFSFTPITSGQVIEGEVVIDVADIDENRGDGTPHLRRHAIRARRLSLPNGQAAAVVMPKAYRVTSRKNVPVLGNMPFFGPMVQRAFKPSIVDNDLVYLVTFHKVD